MPLSPVTQARQAAIQSELNQGLFLAEIKVNKT
jgi:hypothetical protein